MEPPASSQHFPTSFFQKMSRPVGAPVVDLFRILTGLLVSVYYLRLFLEYSTYTSEGGLLDHQLHRELFWFTKLTLFYPGSPPFYKIGLLMLGFLGAIALLVGWRPKLGAAVCLVISVSVHRWNFAVINVDDSSISLLLWWMMFLPIGQTLTPNTFLGKSDWRREAFQVVNGFFVRAFFANLFIYYLTAGLTKLGSELWREGLALYVILNLPLARTQGLWSADHISLLWFGNHFTLLAEPLFPFLVLFPKGSPLKYFGGLCLFVFHLSIPITIGVPYANFALILALVLIFHRELADFLRTKAGESRPVEVLDWKPPRGTRTLALTYLLVLFLAMQKNVPGLKTFWEPAMGVLYLGGIAQEYHLFDWIDRFNWTLQHTIVVKPADGEPFEVASEKLFPHSVRGFIVQSYLLPMRWMRVPRPLTGEMRNSVIRRAVNRFYRKNRSILGEKGEVVVTSRVGRLDKRDLKGEQLWETRLVRFEYTDERLEIMEPKLPQVRQNAR